MKMDDDSEFDWLHRLSYSIDTDALYLLPKDKIEEPLGLSEEDEVTDITDPDYNLSIPEIEQIMNMLLDSNNPFADIFISDEARLPSQEPTLNSLNSYDPFHSPEMLDSKVKIVSWVFKPIIQWEEEDVLLWASCIAMKAKGSMFDSKVTRFSQYQLNGKCLYDMSLSEFIELFPDEEVAKIFYNDLQDLKEKQQQQSHNGSDFNDIKANVLIRLENVQISNDSNDVDMETDSVFHLLEGDDNKEFYTSSDSAIESGGESNSEGETFRHNATAQVKSEYRFIDQMFPADNLLVPGPNHAQTVSGKGNDGQASDKPLKKRVGRPPGSKKQLKEKLGRLWQFLRDLLYNDEYNPRIIRWEEFETGTFRFVNSAEVARLWGEKRENKNMDYGKFSRAMRYHYKNKVLVPVEKKLFYQFGEKAYGWRKTGVKPIISQ